MLPPSRSEREAQLKDKAGWVITAAALLATNALLGGNNSSKILNNTIAANDIWAFYQEKSIKQTAYEFASVQAADAGDGAAVQCMQRPPAMKVTRSREKAKRSCEPRSLALDAERIDAKKRSPWFTYAGSIFQIAIVLLTASILSVSNRLFVASLAVEVGGTIPMSQAIWLWLPISILSAQSSTC